MSLSGSAAEDNSKTNDQQLQYDTPTGPDPTPENPGGVFPQVGASSAPTGTVPGSGPPDHGGDVRGVFGNHEMFTQTFSTLSGAFTTAINAVQDESGSGLGTAAKELIKKLESMRAEIDGWRQGEGLEEVKEKGGERNEDVERAEGDGGGLYAN